MYAHYCAALEDRFLRYVRITSPSDELSNTAPSTTCQLDLLCLLRDELEALGAADVTLTDYGCVLATIPATLPDADIPTVALLAHVDTAPAFNGVGVKPLVHRAYDGRPIVLPDDTRQVLDPAEFPELRQQIGHDLITASGTTLLGADDKAGVAIIMVLAAQLLGDLTIPHGKVRVCFTPDEEIGKGVAHLTLEDLAADVAYTLDGGPVGEVTYETFSADKALVKIKGVSTHTGKAKGKMVNALTLAGKFMQMLPEASRTPETTDGRAGFVHLYKISGTAAEVDIHLILRDFELVGLQTLGEMVCALSQALQATEPRALVECAITPQYRNMRYWLEKDMRPVEIAIAAIRQAGLTPIEQPIRGGTDGARLTERGVLTPNLFTGMQNVHGPLEWISVQDMARAAEVCLNLVQLWAGER